ncbi:hypothetical protein [Methylomonas rapida]|uniref:Uncharacterized protein n=1 Tax=Methylomonas rapida TaxID=2963939 RepID=A0ABY7GLV3_9GAMM|nr:hypothetical protein [Methylomonas rapida]WAR43612.1 hypothetical protein NM686_014655 [Methylomonas rapida]WAR45483.1 hypothetical protein NM686_002925 [Methylomonas rapida]
MTEPKPQYTVTHQPEGGYAGYLLRIIDAERAYAAWLHAQMTYAKSDKWSGWIAAVGLGVVCALMWWQWPAAVVLECAR